MPGTTRAGSYRDVLLLPNALRTFVPALFGRLAYGLLPLSALFTVHQATDSFATAGLAVAAFGLASLSMPLKARLVDRFSQRRVLPPLAVLCASGLAVVASAGTANAVALVILVGVAGLFAPPLGPSMRATWRLITDNSDLKQRAYALDSICEESLYLAGPLIAGLLISFWSAPVALSCAAVLMVGGTLGMVATPLARQVAEQKAGGRFLDPGPLRVAGLRRILLVILFVAGGISVAYVCVAGVAQDQGLAGAAGFVEAGIGLGSVIGGLTWDRRTHTRSHWHHLAGLIALLAVGLLAASLATNLIVLGVVMAVGGLAVAPLFVVSYLAADDLTPPHQRTEASTWINTANNLGSSAGSSLAGLAIDRTTPSHGFLAAGVLLAVLALVSSALRAPSPSSRRSRCSP
ncbi:MFS transporter [Kribbella catacumbae]|uniref:MFS transporter n=1 Tax=Kribbella catacumbae TaxID=460086 RepID=UPI0003750B90|nr:MFS transporter [Kribbella catacumbae]